jgi:hypothetical protein
MTLDFTKHGTVEIRMDKYIKDMLDGILDNINGESPTPAANYLFQVNETGLTSLDKSTAMLFHHNVVKLFFLCKQVSPDIKTAVGFLCTQVKSPDNNNYKKLAQVIKYLQATPKFPLRLQANASHVVQCGLMCDMGSKQT